MTVPTILITGGTGKFGRKFVEHFVGKGWRVLFTATSESRSSELENAFSNPGEITGFISDLTQPDAPRILVEEIQSRGLEVNHLVNNARSLSSLKTDENGATQREDFVSEYLMDVVVPYELAIALYQSQADSLRTVTNIGSQYGLVAANPSLYTDYPKQSPIQYGVAKAALHHLTKELAVRFAAQGVRVNCIAYGGVEGRVDEAFKQRYAELTPSRRMLMESEIAGPLDFLVSETSNAVTGQTLVADGGWSIW
ncbi:MAG: SDR family oxidoreductase [Methylophaga sp.]